MKACRQRSNPANRAAEPRKCHDAQMRVRSRLSATCLTLSLMLGSMWWSAMSTYVVLHDDARFVAALATTLDQPAVRRQLGAWTGAALDQAVRLGGSAEQTEAARQATATLQQTITSTAPIEPLVTAVTAVAVTTRDAAVVQLDAGATPKVPVRADIGPLLGLAGITIDKKTAKAMGLALDKKDKAKVTLPLLTSDQLDVLQRRYDWMVRIRQWAGWLALALLVVSVATSRDPLRTLAIAAGLVAAIALVLPHLLAAVQQRAAGFEVGALVVPLLTAASARLATVAVPVAVVSGLLAVVLGALQVVLRRREHRGQVRDHPGSDSHS